MLIPSLTRLTVRRPVIAKKTAHKRQAPVVYPSVTPDSPLAEKRHALATYDVDLMVRPIGSIPNRRLRTDRVMWSVDVETTGLNHFHDRIVQLAAVPYFPDGTRGPARVWFFDPGMPVSPEAEAVHHLSNEKLRGQPAFEDVAQEIYDTLCDGDILGYNIKAFDIRLIRNAFARAGHPFPKPGTRVIDAFRIFRSNVTRDSAGGNHKLNTAHVFYCNSDIRDAHDAEADAQATLDVLLRQIAVHREVPQDVADLHVYTHEKRPFAREDTYRRRAPTVFPTLRPHISPPLRLPSDPKPETACPVPPLPARLVPPM